MATLVINCVSERKKMLVLSLQRPSLKTCWAGGNGCGKLRTFNPKQAMNGTVVACDSGY